MQHIVYINCDKLYFSTKKNYISLMPIETGKYDVRVKYECTIGLNSYEGHSFDQFSVVVTYIVFESRNSL